MPWTAACDKHRRGILASVVRRHRYEGSCQATPPPFRCNFRGGCRRSAKWELYWSRRGDDCDLDDFVELDVGLLAPSGIVRTRRTPS